MDKIKTLEEVNTKDHSLFIAIFVKNLVGNKISSIDFISISTGPGSYAGIKVGLSFVKGLSFAINKPIVPIDNFFSMNQYIKCKGKYYICIYSHKEYIYTQLYENNNSISEPECLKLQYLKNYTKFGYGLNCFSDIEYTEIKPTSVMIGRTAIKYYDKFLKNDVNDIKPILLVK